MTRYTVARSLTRADRALADRQIAAAKASDVPGFVATLNPTVRTHNRIVGVANAAGFSSSACGELF